MVLQLLPRMEDRPQERVHYLGRDEGHAIGVLDCCICFLGGSSFNEASETKSVVAVAAQVLVSSPNR